MDSFKITYTITKTFDQWAVVIKKWKRYFEMLKATLLKKDPKPNKK